MFESPEFWVVVAFVIFIAGVWRPAKRVLLEALDKRAAGIRAELDEAAKLREEAQATLASYQRRQREALKEAEEILAHTRDEAEIMRNQAAKNLEETLERREKAALERISQAESEAVQEVRDMAVDVAIAATRQLLAEQIDKAKADELIEDSIDELPKKLH